MKTHNTARMGVHRPGTAPDIVRELNETETTLRALDDPLADDTADLLDRAAERVKELEVERDMLRDFADTVLSDCSKAMSKLERMPAEEVAEPALRLGFAFFLQRTGGGRELFTTWRARAAGILGSSNG